MKIDLRVGAWKDWLEVKGLSPKTIEEYNYYINKLDLNKLSQGYLIEFLKNNSNSVARACLANLFNFIKMGEYSNEEKRFIKDLEIPKVTGRPKKSIPPVLTLEQVKSVSKQMNSERNAIMVLISFYGGLRISGLLSLVPYSFNWDAWLRNPKERGRLTVKEKGDKERIVFIPSFLMARLYQWIKSVAGGRTSEERLFRIGDKTWSESLDSASRKAIGRHINHHLLRHSCGSWLMDNGWNLKEIADYLGHTSVVTTQIYTHVSKEKLGDKFEKLVGS